MQLYNRLLREFPDFHDADKVTFYLAHEMRELGQFDEMLKTLGELIAKYPKSPLRLEAEQIIGDYYFDKTDLAEAEKHYQEILKFPQSPVHDLARYKLGWIRVNQQKFNDAVTFFEGAAGSDPIAGVDSQKALNVKREALLDLVYSYTEARPPKGALPYFEKLSDSRTTYALALDKLGNRYFIKQQYEWAIPALRKLMEIQPDPELDLERAEKLYDSLKAAKGKVPTQQEDIKFLVRAAVNVKVDPVQGREHPAEAAGGARGADPRPRHPAPGAGPEDRRPEDVSSGGERLQGIPLALPAREVRPRTSCTTGRMRSSPPTPTPRRHASSRSSRRTRPGPRTPPGPRPRRTARCSPTSSSLKVGEVDKITAFEVADARQALKLDGAKFIAKYPRNPNALTVKFNIARAYYDDGEFERSSQLFTAFAMEYPTQKDAPVAGKLALDGLRQLNDFKGIEETTRKFLANSQLPATFLAEVRTFQAREQGRGARRAGAAELGRDRRRGGGPAQGRQ